MATVSYDRIKQYNFELTSDQPKRDLKQYNFELTSDQPKRDLKILSPPALDRTPEISGCWFVVAF